MSQSTTVDLLKDVLAGYGGEPSQGDGETDTLRKIVEVLGGEPQAMLTGNYGEWLRALGGTPHPSDTPMDLLGKSISQLGGTPHPSQTKNDRVQIIFNLEVMS